MDDEFLAGGSIAKSSISSIFLLQLWPVPTNIKEWELVIGIQEDNNIL